MNTTAVDGAPLGNLDDPSELGPIADAKQLMGQRSPGGKRWLAVLYPGAGEAVAVRTSTGRGSANRTTENDTATARAARKVRRYAMANGLMSFATLTFTKPERDRRRIRRRLKRVFSEMRARLKTRFPYVHVVEMHSDGHGLHVHVLVPRSAGRLLAECWKAGRVHIERLRSREDVRRVSAYVAKDFEHSARRTHRYEVAQGFAPERIYVDADTLAEAQGILDAHMGRPADVSRDYGDPIVLARVSWWE